MDQNNNVEKEITNTKGEPVNNELLTENMNNVKINNETITSKENLNVVANVVDNSVNFQKKKSDDIVVTKIPVEKESSPVLVLVMFLILGLILLFMPIISDKMSGFFEDEVPVDNTQVEEAVLYTDKVSMSGDTSLSLGYFTVSNFEFKNMNDDIYLSYSISKSDEAENYSDNLYIELFDENDEVYRIKIIADRNNSTVNINALGPNNPSTYETVRLIVIDEEDYPEVYLNYDILDEQTLICDRNNIEYSYKFREQVLYRYSETVTVIKGLDEIEYQDGLLVDQNESNYYNGITNITSLLTESDTGYTLVNDFILNDLDKSVIRNDYYFPEGLKADVISFEMEAMGYECR